MQREGNNMGCAELADQVAAVVDVRRLVNDSIRRLAVENGQERFDFVCECGRLECQELVSLSIHDYESTPAGSVLAHERD